MTDIVEKLKDACVIDRHYGKSVTLTLDYDDYMEAADLITALRAEVERLTGERDRQYDQNAEQIIRIAALEAENERLKGFEAANRLNAAQVKAQRAEVERLRAAITIAIRQHEEGNKGLAHHTLCEAVYGRQA